MFPLIFPDALTQTYTDLTDLARAGLAPGIHRMAHDGGRIYKLVKNNHSAALAVGDVVSHDLLTNDSDAEVKRPATADLDRMAGVAVGAIPASGFGWIQVYGYCPTIKCDGSGVNVTAGDSLKAANASLKSVKDAAAGTESAFANHLIAADAVTTDTTVDGWVSCLGF